MGHENSRQTPWTEAAEGSPSTSGSKLTPFQGLVMVATPIGNLEDMGGRAARALGTASLIACEDTRITRRLLSHLGIATEMIAYHDHNAARVLPKIIERLKAGKTVAVVSDAGTPLISDPGLKLVQQAVEAGVPVTAVPGPSALLTALVLSGLPTDRFFFGGFLPRRAVRRRRMLEDCVAVPATLVFYENAVRLPSSLCDMASVLGDRPAAVARELTKLFEEVRRGGLAELAEHYAEAGPPKGEVVVVIGPSPGPSALSEANLDERLGELLDGGQSVRDAAAKLARETGQPRRDLYRRAVALASRNG